MYISTFSCLFVAECTSSLFATLISPSEKMKVKLIRCGSCVIDDDIAVSKCSNLSALLVGAVLVLLYYDFYLRVVVMLLHHILLVYHIRHILFFSLCLASSPPFSLSLTYHTISAIFFVPCLKDLLKL